MPAYRDARDKRVRYEALRAALWTERSSGFDAHWREIGDFLLPRRTRFWVGDRNRGDRRSQHIIDSTARFAVRTLASGLHAGLTSPARPWFKLGAPDPGLNEHRPVKEWLHVVTERMLTIFEQTNLYNVLPMVYADMGTFGTGAMSACDDDEDLFRCQSYPIGSYALGQDARGLTTTFVRDYQQTVRQVVEQFGVTPDGRSIDWTTISSQVKALWDRGDYETAVDLTWLVKPNDDADRGQLDAKYLPWTSCYWERGARGGAGSAPTENKFLRESGFKRFPIMAPRWDITGEDSYGTDCPGMTALGDVKQLQVMQRKKGQAISKMVDPPLVGPPALRAQKTSLLPGDITYLDVREGMQGLRSIHEVTLNIEHLMHDIGEVQYRIQRAFYEDLFLMLAHADRTRTGQPITATEVMERREEKLLALGPVLERTNDELLGPIIDRTFQLMETHGLLPIAPPEIQGARLKVEYLSIMAIAQKQVAVGSIDRFMTSIVPLTQIDPRAIHKVNTYKVIDTLQDALGLDPAFVRTDEDADQLAGAQAQAAQAAAEAEQGLQTAQAAKAASETQLGGDTALSRLAALGGQQLQQGAGDTVPAGPAGY